MCDGNVSVGVVLDIDGVLKCGERPIKGAKEALALLSSRNIKVVFVTNGGGNEEDKARTVSSIIDFPIDSSCVIVSHTPIRDYHLTNTYSGYILAVSHSCKVTDMVSEAYEWDRSRVLTQQRLRAVMPTLYPKIGDKEGEEAPHTSCGEERSSKWDPERTYLKSPAAQIDAIVILHEPNDYAEAFQVICDVLLGQGRLFPRRHRSSTFRQVPMYSSNPDFDYKGEHCLPRYTNGAFVMCLESLYRREFGDERKLEITWFGKPSEATVRYAEGLLGHPSRVFAVGDNPHSDIRNAKVAGPHWTSILVCTGCYHPPPGSVPQGEIEKDHLFSLSLGNDEEYPADYVCVDITHAVNVILSLTSEKS